MSYIGKSPNLGQLYNPDVFSGDGSTTFTLTNSVTSDQSVIVSISGVKQQVSTYTISGTSLVFGTAPPTATNNIEVQYLGSSIDVGTVGNSAIDSAQIASGAVDDSHITGMASSKLTGTIADARFPATLPAVSGANLTGVGVTGITSSANTTAISISADEEVTMPLQPCFNAKMSASRTNVTGNAANYVMAFDTEIFDIGGNYNTGTYKFVAPVTGKYLLTFQAAFANNVSYNAVYWSANIVTSNNTYSNWELDPSIDYRDWMSNMVVVTDMDASDEAYCSVGVTGVGANAIRMDGATSSSFTGVLLA